MSYKNKKDIKSIVAFLCRDSGSHDYTISRTEAKKLGLHVESPNQEAYNELKSWFNNIVEELELKNPYNPSKVLGADGVKNYSFKRGLIESVDYGQDAFISEGTLMKQVMNNNQVCISNDLIYEGWRHL